MCGLDVRRLCGQLCKGLQAFHRLLLVRPDVIGSAARQLPRCAPCCPRSITQVMVMELPSGLKLGRISIDVRNITGDAGGSTDSGTPQDWQQSEHVAGAASSAYSWQALSLSPGEAVVAVSGCHGGFLERLVLHTATGRLWAPQPSTNALCTIPFVEMAPPGGYLVGAQVCGRGAGQQRGRPSARCGLCSGLY